MTSTTAATTRCRACVRPLVVALVLLALGEARGAPCRSAQFTIAGEPIGPGRRTSPTVVFVAVVSLQPSAFRVARSTTIAAPAAAVFAQVNDLHRWEAWNPWQKLDPSARNTHSGAPAGAGATFAWQGNSQVGEGRMTVTESRPNDLIRIRLEFVKPFAATNTAEFTFAPEGQQTRVTWSMFGENTFLSKAIGLFISMDAMIGAQFEKGLADLKAVVESSRSSRRLRAGPRRTHPLSRPGAKPAAGGCVRQPNSRAARVWACRGAMPNLPVLIEW